MNLAMRLKAMLIATVAGVVLAGCSGGSAGSAEKPTQADQTLRLSQSAPPSNFSIGNWSGGDDTLFLSVYDTIVHTNPQDGSLSGGIAKGWEYSPDRTKLTLHVRDGQKFTDGEALDANAVVGSLEAARKGASTAQYLASIASLAAPDASTVVISLSHPDASLIPALGSVAGAVGAPNVLTAETSKLKPIGSGPYSLDQTKTTAGSKYVLTKNADYWNAGAYPYKTVEIQVIADLTAAQNALLSGQLDYSYLASPDMAKQFPAPKFATGKNLPTAVGALWIVDRNGTVVPALKDVRVRQAINMAFDRTAIEKNLGQGSNHATEQILNPTGGAWSDDLNSTYSHNVQQAKALLAQAGYPDGFAVTMPSVTGITSAFEPVITQSLADIGIKVTWETVAFQDFYTKAFSHRYGMFFMYNALRSADALDVNVSTSGVFNPFGDTTPELQDLLAKANTSDSKDAFRAVNKYFVDQAWFAPLAYSTTAYAVSSKISYTPPKAFAMSVLPWAPAQ